VRHFPYSFRLIMIMANSIAPAVTVSGRGGDAHQIVDRLAAFQWPAAPVYGDLEE